MHIPNEYTHIVRSGVEHELRAAADAVGYHDDPLVRGTKTLREKLMHLMLCHSLALDFESYPTMRDAIAYAQPELEKARAMLTTEHAAR